MNESCIHKKFIIDLENIINKYSEKFSDDSNNRLSIFFCETYTILEALERGEKVIHICSDPVFQSYSEKLWSGIIVDQISKYVFSYRLKELGHCINFGKEEDTFHKYINSI